MSQLKTGDEKSVKQIIGVIGDDALIDKIADRQMFIQIEFINIFDMECLGGRRRRSAIHV